MIEIESELTREQYMKLVLLMIVRRASFVFLLVTCFFFLIIGLLAGDRVYVIIAGSGLALVALIDTIQILYMGLSPKNRNFFLNLHFVFSDENVVVKSPVSEEVVKWEAFVNCKKIAGYFLLYVSSTGFLAIPKSAIPAGEIDYFENLLQENIQKD